MAEQQHAGWAQGEHDPPAGPFATDMTRPRGVLVTDMPARKPVVHRPKIKGLPGPTSSADEDHQPGGGAWRPVS